MDRVAKPLTLSAVYIWPARFAGLAADSLGSPAAGFACRRLSVPALAALLACSRFSSLPADSIGLPAIGLLAEGSRA